GMKELSIIAETKVQLEGWKAFRFECVVGGWIVAGSSAELKKTGKNKGSLKWLSQNQKKVIVTIEEFEVMKASESN
ncbi:MAG: hypothetical protein ABL925_17615, partial [Methylococcales bacterium]